MITDPISDMLTRIRNASVVSKTEVVLPYSKIKFAIAKILKEEGYVLDAKKENEGFGQLKIKLKYEQDKKSSINSIKRISKPGRRFYCSCDNLPRVLGGIGVAIISTSCGLMTNTEARKRRLGGEVICEVY
ncbi:MAG: 30S ribosomal protein S8 [Patescibacteria group bacterium]|nr:30S ribosomal protein S8 [Patescibacteria group bacterium]